MPNVLREDDYTMFSTDMTMFIIVLMSITFHGHDLPVSLDFKVTHLSIPWPKYQHQQ